MKYVVSVEHIEDVGSLPARGVRIEIAGFRVALDGERSLPARGVRIEMDTPPPLPSPAAVTPRKGSAD